MGARWDCNCDTNGRGYSLERCEFSLWAPDRNHERVIQHGVNDAFTLYAMEQEGEFDYRTRDERIEDVIKILVAAGDYAADYEYQDQVLCANGIDDLSEEEAAYIAEEIEFRMRGF